MELTQSDKAVLLQETSKTALERAEDIAYTINHSLACTSLDLLRAPLDNYIQKSPLNASVQHVLRRMLYWLHPHKHDDGHDHHGHHDHDSHDHDHGHGSVKSWLLGHAIGDFGAVPVTIALQRFAPGFMNVLRRGMEKVLGGVFMRGATRAGHKWAAVNGFSLDSTECRQKILEIYEHEMRHLPQALVWTVASFAMNITAQKATGTNKGTVLEIATTNAMGAAATATLVVGSRAIAPQGVRKWDRFTSRHIFLPVSKRVGGAFGIDETIAERVAAQAGHPEDESWAGKLKHAESQAPQTATR